MNERTKLTRDQDRTVECVDECDKYSHSENRDQSDSHNNHHGNDTIKQGEKLHVSILPRRICMAGILLQFPPPLD